MGTNETLRSTYSELLASQRYLEMPDADLYERMTYWREQPTAADRSPRGREAARTIFLRLSLEITEREAEKSQLEEQLAATVAPTFPSQRIPESLH